MQLGQTIVKIRKEHDLSQEKFANMFNVTRQTVSNWENEKSYPDLLTLVKISDMFGYALDTMLKENPDMTKKMNNDMKLGSRLEKIYSKRLEIAVIGSVICCITWFISWKFFNNSFEIVVWIMSIVICVLITIGYIYKKRFKSE